MNKKPKKTASKKGDSKELLRKLNGLMKQISTTGTEIYSGYIQNDENDIFNNIQDRAKLIEKMMRTDVAVNAAVTFFMVPILGAEYYIDHPDEEVKAFFEKCLFNMDGRSWKQFLYEAMLYPFHGFYPFEKVYKITEDGKVGIKDLSPIIPKAVDSFMMSNGEFGIKMYAFGDLAKIEGDVEQGTIRNIPMKKLLLFTNNKTGDNWQGESLLRPAYRHYAIKDIMYTVSGIAAERFGVGVPRASISRNVSAEDKAKAEEILQNIRVNESSYVLSLKDVYDIDFMELKSNSLAPMMEFAISHHNRMILSSTLSHSLDLGGNGGSQALSKEQRKDAIMLAQDKLSVFLQTIQKGIIEELVKINFGELEVMPTIKHTPLTAETKLESAQTLALLSKSGLIKVDGELIRFIHSQFNLPDIDGDDIDEIDKTRMENEIQDLLNSIQNDQANTQNTEV